MIDQQTIYQYIQNGKIEEALQALFGNIEEDPTIIENYIMLVSYLLMRMRLKRQSVFSKKL